MHWCIRPMDRSIERDSRPSGHAASRRTPTSRDGRLPPWRCSIAGAQGLILMLPQGARVPCHAHAALFTCAYAARASAGPLVNRSDPTDPERVAPNAIKPLASHSSIGRARPRPRRTRHEGRGTTRTNNEGGDEILPLGACCSAQPWQARRAIEQSNEDWHRLLSPPIDTRPHIHRHPSTPIDRAKPTAACLPRHNSSKQQLQHQQQQQPGQHGQQQRHQTTEGADGSPPPGRSIGGRQVGGWVVWALIGGSIGWFDWVGSVLIDRSTCSSRTHRSKTDRLDPPHQHTNKKKHTAPTPSSFPPPGSPHPWQEHHDAVAVSAGQPRGWPRPPPRPPRPRRTRSRCVGGGGGTFPCVQSIDPRPIRVQRGANAARVTCRKHTHIYMYRAAGMGTGVGTGA